MLASFDKQLAADDNKTARQDMVRKVIQTFVDTKGALEAKVDAGAWPRKQYMT
jgi:hypothetical protein